MSEDSKSTGQFEENVFRNAFELWITPEVKRRQLEGNLPKPVSLLAAQVVFAPEGKPLVRLNNEVRGRARVKLRDGIEEGDPVYGADVEDYEGFDLLSEEADFGHMTLIRHRQHWVMMFDFSVYKGHASALVARAEEFFSAAQSSLERGHVGAYVDNLFSCSELLARARLLNAHMLEKDWKTHDPIHSRINDWRRLGNVDGEFVDLLNDLRNARPTARYSPDTPKARRAGDRAIQIVAEQIDQLKGRLERIE